MNKYEKLFTPIRIGNRILKNRIEAAPAALSNLTPEGYFTDQNIATFERKAIASFSLRLSRDISA